VALPGLSECDHFGLFNSGRPNDAGIVNASASKFSDEFVGRLACCNDFAVRYRDPLAVKSVQQTPK